LVAVPPQFWRDSFEIDYQAGRGSLIGLDQDVRERVAHGWDESLPALAKR
jgi:hypothetical protein